MGSQGCESVAKASPLLVLPQRDQNANQLVQIRWNPFESVESVGIRSNPLESVQINRNPLVSETLVAQTPGYTRGRLHASVHAYMHAEMHANPG